MTVNQALDEASIENFNEDFDHTDLYNSFTSIWPIYRFNATSQQWEWQDDTGEDSVMAVYGNGNIHLYEYFVHYPYVNQGSYGSGSVSNPNGFTGAQPNGDCTRLIAGTVGDQAGVIGSMGYTGANEANGHIWVYGNSTTYTSRLRVYVSYYSDSGWQQVSDLLINPSSPHWIDCGTALTNFRYISFTVYRQGSTDYNNDVCLDSVLVLPPLPKVKPPTTPETETLWVNYFTGTMSEWSTIGSSPYLDESTSSYIYQSGNHLGEQEYYFHFSNPVNGQGSIGDIRLQLLCRQTDPQERMGFTVGVAAAKNTSTTGSGYVSYEYLPVNPPYGTAQVEEIDISSWVDSWEELDNVRLRFNYTSYYDNYEMDIYSAKIEVDYWPIVTSEKDIVIFGNETSYPWLSDWRKMLDHYDYDYALVDPSQISHGIINKAHSLIVASNMENEIPGRNNLWGAILIQEASADIPVLCHMYSYCYQVYRQDDGNYGGGWGPLHSAYKYSNATSIRDLLGADMQNITFATG